MAHGATLDLLGLTVTFDHSGFILRPMQDKILKWSKRISDALESGSLAPGQASKLAGALSWAAQHSFHRIGRALLRPLFIHANQARARTPEHVRLCLEWWKEVLLLDLEEKQCWSQDRRGAAHLFADARGSPPRLAAVVLLDGRSMYTDFAPPCQLVRSVYHSAR